METEQETSVAETSRTARVLEITAVVMLSITAVLTAWCGFQAAKWGGEMSIAFSQASSNRIQSAAAEAQASDARLYDLSMYTQWVTAEADDRSALRDYIEERFTTEFREAFDAWEEGGREEAGPFAMAEYHPPGAADSAQLSDLADRKFDQALENNQRGDDYSLLTVLFALVLFLTAISQRAVALWAQGTLIALALAVALAGIVLMFTFPVLI